MRISISLGKYVNSSSAVMKGYKTNSKELRTKILKVPVAQFKRPCRTSRTECGDTPDSFNEDM